MKVIMFITSKIFSGTFNSNYIQLNHEYTVILKCGHFVPFGMPRY